MPEQFAGVSMMVWLACVYALGLVAVGWGFDILAKRTSQRFVASRTFGFTYHESNDAWLCPEDQWLWPVAFDTDNRVMRYRAKPSVCNTCPIKDTCTVSSNGRELTREVDEWPYSESGKFHRGLAVAVALFGPVIMVAAAFGWHSPIELLIELAAVVVCLSLTYPLAIKLIRSPENFAADPKHIPGSSADESVATKIDRFAAKWGGVGNERKRRTDDARKQMIASAQLPVRPSSTIDPDRPAWSGEGTSTPRLHKTTAEVIQEQNLEEANS
ncbi:MULTISPECIES: transposase [Rothia]|nr:MULTISPECIES: transposase [Rothia]MBF1646709.1 transposase [Rothia dentocariosa]KGI99738.1 transposase [Rothia aeria]KGJ34540.1 transposase [Rothia aeria]MBF1653220.1 transposase [Rothia dentocariosa]MDO4883724.1 transposase [Rothia sp. (in: high G+C Gram-positive bacteria)]